MPRKGRIEFAGAFYHLLDRGDRREDIVRDETDRARFIGTLGEVCARTGWRVHAFVLMSSQRRQTGSNLNSLTDSLAGGQ
jgi:putative transposase